MLKDNEMTKTKAVDNPNPTDSDCDAVVAELHAEGDDLPISNPVIDRRQVYSINRMRIIDTSLDEGEKLHGQGCIKRGVSPEHFVFRAPNNVKTRHDLYIRLETHNPQTIWDALLCSCPTGRHAGDPCWHKGAVRAFLADNEHIRHANRLLALSLT